MRDDLNNLPKWDGPERRELPRTGPEWLWFGEEVWIKERIGPMREAAWRVTEAGLYVRMEEAYRSAFRLGYKQGRFDERLEL